MTITLRFIAGLAAGCVTAIAIGLAATLAARILWPAYAAAEPEKAYTIAMLVSRLITGAACAAGGAWVTTVIVRDKGQAAWWLGGLLLAVSLPIHLGRVWADYPVWYHLIYLCSLVPVAGLAGRTGRRR